MPKIVALHLIALILCAPLFGAYALSPGEGRSGAEWVIAIAAFVYGGVLLTSKPASLFEGALKIGIGARPMRLILLSVALIMVCVPLLDAHATLLVGCGFACMVGAAVAFVLAVRHAYSDPITGA